jgi:elongator complex protein 2
MLASGSQDAYIRLWRISRVSQNVPVGGASSQSKLGDRDELNDEMLDEFERRMRGEGLAGDEEGQSGQLSTKAHALVVDDGSA